MSGLISTDHSVLALQGDLRYDSSMTNIDWTRLTEPVDNRTADEFRRDHAAQARLTLEEFDRWLVVEREGDRWIAVPRTKVRREQREARRRS